MQLRELDRGTTAARSYSRAIRRGDANAKPSGWQGDALRRLDPDLQHVVEWRLPIEQVHALQRNAQRACRVAHERVPVRAAEMTHGVAPQLDHVEARAHLDRRTVDGFDRDV